MLTHLLVVIFLVFLVFLDVLDILDVLDVFFLDFLVLVFAIFSEENLDNSDNVLIFFNFSVVIRLLNMVSSLKRSLLSSDCVLCVLISFNFSTTSLHSSGLFLYVLGESPNFKAISLNSESL